MEEEEEGRGGRRRGSKRDEVVVRWEEVEGQEDEDEEIMVMGMGKTLSFSAFCLFVVFGCVSAPSVTALVSLHLSINWGQMPKKLDQTMNDCQDEGKGRGDTL